MGVRKNVYKDEETKKAVFIPSEQWVKEERFRVLCRDIFNGVEALRDKEQTYLPQKTMEEDTAYQKRLANATLYNMFDRAIQGLTGRVFSKVMEPRDVPEKLEGMYEDIDFHGNNIDMFCKEIFMEAMVEGISYIFVDYPPAANVKKNREEEKKQKRRPYWIHYRPYEVIGVRFKKREGIPYLDQVRIRQTIDVPENEFSFTKVERVRVYTPGLCTEYERAKGDKDIKNVMVTEYDMGLKGIIPIIPVYTQKTGLFQSDPPLYDMARLNIRHFQSNSAQDHILDYSRFPILFGRRIYMDGEETSIMGAGNMIHSTDEHADLRYVESTCAAIEAGAKSLRELEDRIAAMSHEPLLIRRTGQETATRAAIDSAAAASALQSWALQLKDAIEYGMVLTAAWENVDEGKAGSIQMNTDYQLTISSTDSTDLLNIRKAGELSRKTLWSEYARRGLFGPDFDSEEEEKLLNEEGSFRDMTEGVLPVLVNMRILPKKYLFDEAKRRGFIREEYEWEDVKALLDDDTRHEMGPIGSLSGLAARLRDQTEGVDDTADTTDTME